MQLISIDLPLVHVLLIEQDLYMYMYTTVYIYMARSEMWSNCQRLLLLHCLDNITCS